MLLSPLSFLLKSRTLFVLFSSRFSGVLEARNNPKLQKHSLCTGVLCKDTFPSVKISVCTWITHEHLHTRMRKHQGSVTDGTCCECVQSRFVGQQREFTQRTAVSEAATHNNQIRRQRTAGRGAPQEHKGGRVIKEILKGADISILQRREFSRREKGSVAITLEENAQEGRDFICVATQRKW